MPYSQQEWSRPDIHTSGPAPAACPRHAPTRRTSAHSAAYRRETRAVGLPLQRPGRSASDRASVRTPATPGMRRSMPPWDELPVAGRLTLAALRRSDSVGVSAASASDGVYARGGVLCRVEDRLQPCAGRCTLGRSVWRGAGAAGGLGQWVTWRPRSASRSSQRRILRTRTSQSPCPRPEVRAASPSEAGLLRYEVAGLGLPDRSTSSAYAGLAINDAGQVVGTAVVGGANGVDRAYRWTPGGRVDYIEGAEGQETVAQDVNSSGQVAGDVWPASDGSQPFVWDEGPDCARCTLTSAPTSSPCTTCGSMTEARYPARWTTASTGLPGSVAFRMEPDGTVSEAPLKQTVGIGHERGR